MTIAWQTFTPLSALLGGVLIGLAAALLVLYNGRIAGISGILGGLLRPKFNSSEIGWRVAFISGLVLSPVLYGLLFALPAIEIDASHATLVAAGLLVGVAVVFVIRHVLN